MTNIFTDEELVIYASERFLGEVDGRQLALQEIHEVELFNGVLPSQLESILGERGQFQRVKQVNEREPIYWMGGHLCIPQYSSIQRGKRYEKLITKLIDFEKRKGGWIKGDLKFTMHSPFEFKSGWVEGEPRDETYWYDFLGYDFIVGMFVPRRKHENRRVFPKDAKVSNVRDIGTIIFGPLDAVAEQAEVITSVKTQYLDAQIVRIGKKLVLNIGYTYGEQARILMSKLLHEHAGIAKKQMKVRDINIYMFGSAGGLADNLNLYDVVFPTHSINDTDAVAGWEAVYPIHNILAPMGTSSTNYTVQSVVDETYEQLQAAKNMGCSTVEMEVLEASMGADAERRLWQNSADMKYGLRINTGYALWISDLPLAGRKLSSRMPSLPGERAAVRNIVDHINSSSR